MQDYKKNLHRFLVINILLAVGLRINLQMSRFCVHGHYDTEIEYALIWLNFVIDLRWKLINLSQLTHLNLM